MSNCLFQAVYEEVWPMAVLLIFSKSLLCWDLVPLQVHPQLPLDRLDQQLEVQGVPGQGPHLHEQVNNPGLGEGATIEPTQDAASYRAVQEGGRK